MKNTHALLSATLLIFSFLANGCSQADLARQRLNESPGGQLVLQAIDAHGGLQAWYNAPTSAYHWEYSNNGMGLRFKTDLVVDNKTRQAYHTLKELGTPDRPQPATGRFAWNGVDAWVIPPDLPKVNARFWSLTGYYFQSIPFVLADPGVRYELLPDEQLDGVTHHMVRCAYDVGVGDFSGDTYTLYVHPKTHRVSAIRYTVTYGREHPEDVSAMRETLFYYLDYVTVDGLTTATHYRGYGFADGQKGSFRNEAWASNISFRKPFDESQLVAPAGAKWIPRPEPK